MATTSAPSFSAPFHLEPESPTSYASSLSSFFAPVGGLLDRFNRARDALNLPDPGKAEDLAREVKNVHYANFAFDGARADLSKTLSQIPAFQVTHSFTTGAQGQMGPSPGTYSFGAVYATNENLMQGSIDNEGSVNGRLNHTWSPAALTKLGINLQRSPTSPSMFTIEHDHIGKDFTLGLKAYNPSPADLTGTYIAQYLQSLTPHFALGVEALYQRPTPQIEEVALGYMAKLHDVKKDLSGQPLTGSWIASAQLMSQGVLQATYWKKLAERVEAAVDLTVLPAVDPSSRKAIATAGVKYDFRMSTFRGQVDSDGKVGALLEQRLSPLFAFLISGEMDHKTNKSKFGLGIMVESASEETIAAAEAAAQAAAQAQARPM
ncbi:BQ2448_4822 [Microbotryum intermedium]|uniref:BQ2448_4822 protein n=1 Tax=Microbotryum intermedium TaxID=269621 RepID=A0A238FLS2_9BASI|nr:BQ2448_4822 [Microbotryum intermedium]